MKKEFLKDENGNVIGRKRGRYVDVRVNVNDAYIKLKNGKQIIVDKADLEKVLMLTYQALMGKVIHIRMAIPQIIGEQIWLRKIFLVEVNLELLYF